MSALSTPYEMGRQASLLGYSVHYNPFRNGPPENYGDYVAWEDGWHSVTETHEDNAAA